jgi:hypothetical protein
MASHAPEAAPPPARGGGLRRFLLPADDTAHAAHPTQPWYSVLWLTGVDYFSTLGYQPGIAFLAAGALSPLATLILVIVTLAGALPVYAQVARRSYAGQGSIAMLERLLPGWKGKVFVLALLGFGATDFVITMTLSAADAAQHAVENPFLHTVLGDHKLAVTCGLLVLLAVVFLRGFGEAIGVAVVIGLPYLVLNGVVLARGMMELARHPEVLVDWRHALQARGDPTMLLIAALLIFPKLALGMSGFETGVSVMPLVRGAADDGDPPLGRVRATRRLLTAAALIMSVLLLASSLVTTTLIPAAEFETGGKASGRALAYLAHLLLGDWFGSLYDVSTIVILWFAGASAMAGILNLIPRYLPRFGMAPEWAKHQRPLVLLLLAIDLAVTWIFKADVEAQGGAYATGVLVLMLSAAAAVALSLGREATQARSGRLRAGSLYFWLITALFTYTLGDNVIERPDGVIIASLFILTIVVLSAISRALRATELRVEHLTIADGESEQLWAAMRGKRVNFVPIKWSDAPRRRAKAAELRRYYRAEAPLAFLHVALADDRSEFQSALRVTVRREDDDFLVEVTGAVAIANTIAWISEQLDPIAIYLGLSLLNPFAQAAKYLLWGEGETAAMVHGILARYWHDTERHLRHPLIFMVTPEDG